MKLIKFSSLLIASLMTVSAHAQIITYDFTSIIYSAWGANSPFHEGDLVQGRLIYDTIATPRYTGPKDNPNYSGAMYNTDFNLNISFITANFSYNSEGKGPNHFEVISDAAKVDFFSGTATEHAGLTLSDFTKRPIVNAKIPTELDLALYEYKNFAYGLNDSQFKPVIGFASELKSLNFVSSVPEPDSRLLLVVGMFAVGFWSSKFKTRQKA